MTRRGTGLVLGTAGTLLLCAWVSAAGKVGVFADPDLSGPDSPAPGQEYGPTGMPPISNLGGKGRPDAGPDDALAGVIAWGMKLLLVAVVLAVLVAVARSLLAKWQGREQAQAEEVTSAVLPEKLLATARESEELLSRGTPANAVVAAWVALEDAVRDAGVREDRARTSAELVHTVLRSHAVDAAALDRLAALYREARFSRHPIGEDRRDQARAALHQVQADLVRAAARPGRATGSRTTPASPSAGAPP